MKLSILALSLATVVFGTSMTTEVSAANSPAVTHSDDKSVVHAGKSVFVFALLPEGLQEYAYRDVCADMPKSTSECLGGDFPYKKYAGMKGYYTDRAPKKFYNGEVVREGVLENGETVYLVSSEKYKSVGDGIISLAEHEKIINFKPEQLVAGSKTSISGVSLLTREYEVSSQDGHSFSDEEVAAIREIAGRYSPEVGARIADLMSTLKVDHDSFDQRATVAFLPYNNKESFISLKVIFDENGVFLPAIETRYHGYDWLFVDGYAVSADGKKFDFKSEEFQRDNSGKYVWEWYTRPLQEGELEALESIANANRSVVRFRGKQYFADHELTSTQKEELRNLTELVRLLNQAKKA